MTNFFRLLGHRIIKNIGRIFWGYNLLWHAAAIILTWAIVSSDFDWKYFLATRNNLVWPAALPAVAFGSLLPLLAPPVVWAVGHFRKDRVAMLVGGALGQAAILGSFISSIYKAFTGRIPPELARGLSASVNAQLSDISHGFRFGFLRGGIFWGWPSSHTTIAFSMAMALVTMFPKNKILRVLAPAYALYVGLATSVSIHWLSESVAGAIIGTVIGVAVGKSFRQLLV